MENYILNSSLSSCILIIRLNKKNPRLCVISFQLSVLYESTQDSGNKIENSP